MKILEIDLNVMGSLDFASQLDEKLESLATLEFYLIGRIPGALREEFDVVAAIMQSKGRYGKFKQFI